MGDKKEISLELLQEILDYLQVRPYNEVYPLIHKILKELENNKEK